MYPKHKIQFVGCYMTTKMIETYHYPTRKTVMIYTMHRIALLYLVCPYVLHMAGETSYRIQVGLIASDIIFTIILIIYLFVTEVQSLLLSSWSN